MKEIELRLTGGSAGAQGGEEGVVAGDVQDVEADAAPQGQGAGYLSRSRRHR